MPDERRKRVILNDRNGYVIQRLKPILYTWDEAAFKNVVVNNAYVILQRV